MPGRVLVFFPLWKFHVDLYRALRLARNSSRDRANVRIPCASNSASVVLVISRALWTQTWIMTRRTSESSYLIYL
jgi:hypothetical protein